MNKPENGIVKAYQNGEYVAGIGIVEDAGISSLFGKVYKVNVSFGTENIIHWFTVNLISKDKF